MQKKFTRQAQQALKLAEGFAKRFGHNYVGTEHLLLGLLKEPEGTAGKVLEGFAVEEGQLVELIEKLIAPSHQSAQEGRPEFSPRTEAVIERAAEEAEFLRHEQIGTEHLLLAMLKDTDCVGTRLLYTMGVGIQKLYSGVLTAMGLDTEGVQEEFQAARIQKNGSGTPVLDQYSRDLTALASEGHMDPVV